MPFKHCIPSMSNSFKALTKSADITEEEYIQIQNGIRKDPTKSYLGDMKQRESNLEKENLFKVKEKAKIAKEIFEKMIPQININKPKGKLYLSIFFNLFTYRNLF